MYPAASGLVMALEDVGAEVAAPISPASTNPAAKKNCSHLSQPYLNDTSRPVMASLDKRGRHGGR
jgi:hypothetical protein